VKAVVLAGGRGTRLAPYTSVLPKPLMPIGDRAILEIVVEQLVRAGFTEVTFCVGYLSHLIEALFNSGNGRGVHIEYVREKEPLGTAGPLRIVPRLDDTFLAMNGDVLTTLDYRDFIEQHRSSGNTLTIATHERTVKMDYGVLHLDNIKDGMPRLVGYEEKPEFPMVVSMGVYALEPRGLSFIPDDAYFDVPALVQALLEAGEPVGAYRHDGFWLDIGRHEDYEQATTAWEALVQANTGRRRQHSRVDV
jgi:NDP-sugar pyrophosphorylase family protein